MREYLFYVLLVFLPVGAFMVKILLDYGLPIKNTAYIVLTSLAIIITFPISMERLGIFLAFTVYAILIALIIFYMVKTSDDLCLEAVTTDGISEDKADNSVPAQNCNANLALELEAPDIIDKQPEAVSNEQLVKEEAKNDTIEDKDFFSLINNCEVDDRELDNTEVSQSENADEVMVNVNDESLTGEDIKFLPEENNTNISDLEADNSQKEMWVKTDEQLVEEGLIDNNEPLTDEAIEAFAIKDEIEDEIVQEKIVLGEINNEAVQEEIITTPESIEEEEIIPVSDNSVINEEEVKDQGELSEELVTYINDAFMYKTEGNNEKAIEKFLVIWENTKDYDLKHLVTLELAEMYKALGCYSSARELLTITYNEIKDINSVIASQLGKELTYIGLLISEINRLGIEPVPFDRLPRWVKIKVADELNQLD